MNRKYEFYKYLHYNYNYMLSYNSHQYGNNIEKIKIG